MTEFFVMFGNLWKSIIDTLSLCTFEINGFTVSLPAVWFALLVVGLVITVFWKGAKT